MVIVFDNDELEAIYQGRKTKAKPKYPQEIINQFSKTVKLMSLADDIMQLNRLKD